MLYCDQSAEKRSAWGESKDLHIDRGFLANWDWNTRIFGNLAYVASVYARVRGECWDESKNEKSLNFHFFCSHSNFRAITRIRRLCPDNIHLHQSVIFTQRLCHGHADDLFPIFFLFTETFVIASHAGVFWGRRFSSLPGKTEQAPIHPQPLVPPKRNYVTFSFCNCQKGQIIKHFNLQIFYV